MNRSGKVNSVLHRFLISHMALIILMILALVLVNVIYTGNFQDMVFQSAQQELAESAELFEVHLNEVWNTAYSLAQNSYVAAMGKAKILSIDDYAQLHDMNHSVKATFQNNAFISDIVIVFSQSKSVWTGKHGFLSAALAQNVERNFYAINDAPLQDYVSSCQSQSAGAYLDWVAVYAGEAQVMHPVFYVNLYPLSSFTTSASVLFILDPAQSQKLFSFSRYLENGGNFSISDLSGRMIMQMAPGSSNAKSYLFKYQPYKSQYEYHLAVPADYISSRVQTGQRTSILISVVLFILAFGLAYFFSHLHTKPVRQLVAMVSDDAPKKNELFFLHNSIREILNDRERLEENLRQQTVLHLNMVFTRLLAYEYRSEDEAMAALAKAGVMPDYSNYLVTFIHAVPSEKTENIESNVLIYNLLHGFFGRVLCIYSLSSHSYAVFSIRRPEETAENTGKLLEKAFGEIGKNYGIHLEGVVGKAVSSLLSLPEALRQAQREYYSVRSQPHPRVLLAGEEKEAEYMNWVLAEGDKRRLTSFCQAGNYALIEECIADFFARQSAIEPANKQELLQLGYDFRSLFFHIQMQTSSVAIHPLITGINSLPGAQNDEEMKENVLKIFRQLCQQVYSYNENGGYRQYIEVRDYVKAHYTDQDLSLTSIAEVFGLSDKYLSFLYKKNGGVNLAAEIENLRLSRAVELMEDDAMSLADISLSSGYSNSNSFYKAFKRVYGLSPSQYRTTHRPTE